ncbi:disease resistance protein RPV1-like isoform X1 [Vitis riparia]|uniref:disease resistance protein RPV1-like isoform X1 n=1 Tax=Vitis riparia TaxID=96939 RepID=UPI00155B3C79|nr:disease resistance protein RPV1-like isoform X1 [Vitis riparia]
MASTSTLRASSSSTPSIPQTSTYDVFLSSGADTHYNFTHHLYKALGSRGVLTFRNDNLMRGEAIAPEILKAIEGSRSSVIVFSKNYAHSRWCLDELVKIMERQKDLGHAVFPIFYHVDPSHVHKQEGSFGAAFAGYEENWKDKIPRWRMTLTEAANLSGWHLGKKRYESDQIRQIVDNIFRQLRFDVGANLVGMDSRVKEMILRLNMESSDVRIVGIYGVGGIGSLFFKKTILQWESEWYKSERGEMKIHNVLKRSYDGPNKWSRLWDPRDFERALTYEGIEGVETKSFDLSKLKRNSNVLAKMTRLRANSSMTLEPVYGISPNGQFKRTINSWARGEFLGSGSFGIVYEGYTDDGFFFAVKEVSLLDQGGKGKQSIYQLEQEISLLSQLEHENIVRYYGTNKDDSKLYIFLELVTKVSLLSLYQKYHLQESQASVYTKQILNGLKYLHEQNVVHSHQDVELICMNYTIPGCIACLLREYRFTLLWKFSLLQCFQIEILNLIGECSCCHLLFRVIDDFIFCFTVL